jgi:hypothetical protein
MTKEDAIKHKREERRKKMRKIIVAVMVVALLATAGVVFLLVAGCATMAPMEVKEEKYGKSIPVITQSFASPEIRPGDTWKVYLKASDPDGEMKNLYATVFQYGMGPYPISITRIKEGDDKNLSGYFYLNTGNDHGMIFKNLIVTVEIQDKAGHFSAPAVFPVAFYAASVQQSPPTGVFQEKDLGPIMVDLRSSNDGSHDGRDFK